MMGLEPIYLKGNSFQSCRNNQFCHMFFKNKNILLKKFNNNGPDRNRTGDFDMQNQYFPN